MISTQTSRHAPAHSGGLGASVSLLSPAEYARLHGISAERVRQLCRTGRIPRATLRTLGPMTMWLIPSDVADPRLPRGRPCKPRVTEPSAPSQPQAKPRISLYQPDPETQRLAKARLHLGRQEAQTIIKAMKKKGVKIALFGSMKTGRTTPFSDIDLLITDPGPMGALRAISETLAERLTIPVDVVAAETIGTDAFARIKESLNA